MNIMLDIQQKRKLRSFLYHKGTLAVLFVFVLLMVHSTWVVYEKKVESEQLMNLSKQRVDELNKRDHDLDYKINRLDTEVGIEEEIRSKFTVTKENENVVVVVPRVSEEASSTPKKPSFFTRFLNLFK